MHKLSKLVINRQHIFKELINFKFITVTIIKKFDYKAIHFFKLRIERHIAFLRFKYLTYSNKLKNKISFKRKSRNMTSLLVIYFNKPLPFN